MTTDIHRVRQIGTSWNHPLLIMVALKTDNLTTRLGMVASNRVGGAVTRNAVKRRIRACITQVIDQVVPGWDLLFIVRSRASKAKYAEICEAILYLLQRASLILDR
jgi:ribonuclease P protein component